jgi:RNA polymerase sigma factor (sigma-70 family)
MSGRDKSNDAAKDTPAEQELEATLIDISALARRAARKAVGRDEAADIAHDVVLECLIKLRSGEWKPGMRQIRPMVLGMVRRRAANFFRSRSRRQAREAEYAHEQVKAASLQSAPDLEAEGRELEEAHTKALDTLPSSCRRVYVTVVQEQAPHREVAQMLGISRRGVSWQFRIAEQRLRRVLSTVGFPELDTPMNVDGDVPDESTKKQ